MLTKLVFLLAITGFTLADLMNEDESNVNATAADAELPADATHVYWCQNKGWVAPCDSINVDVEGNCIAIRAGSSVAIHLL